MGQEPPAANGAQGGENGKEAAPRPRPPAPRHCPAQLRGRKGGPLSPRRQRSPATGCPGLPRPHCGTRWGGSDGRHTGTDPGAGGMTGLVRAPERRAVTRAPQGGAGRGASTGPGPRGALGVGGGGGGALGEAVPVRGRCGGPTGSHSSEPLNHSQDQALHGPCVLPRGKDKSASFGGSVRRPRFTLKRVKTRGRGEAAEPELEPEPSRSRSRSRAGRARPDEHTHPAVASRAPLRGRGPAVNPAGTGDVPSQRAGRPG